MAPKKKLKEEAPVWKFKKDNKWEPYAPVDSQLLEEAYQSKSTDGTFTTGALSFNKGYSTKYLFDFTTMTQKNLDSNTVRQVQRIGTSAEFAWEWEDDAGLFVPFFDADTAEIERLFAAAGVGGSAITKNLSFNAGYDSPYQFTFEKVTADGAVVGSQKNKESGTVRKIRRLKVKPAPWEAKGFGISAATAVPTAAEIDAASAPSAPSAAGTAADKAGGSGGGEAKLTRASTLSIPAHWTATKGGFDKIGGYTRVELDAKSDEFQLMATAVSSTITKRKVKVMAVARIENAALWAFYAITRAHIAKRNKGDPNERMLFYGERSAANMETIMKFGFDVRVAQDANFGQGLYFGVNAATCDSGLVKENKDGSRELFVCNVTLGQIQLGSKGIRRPPPKDPKVPTGELYDACADKLDSPNLYVLFNQSQAYPAYVVQYA